MVRGASQGVSASVANLFLDRGYNVVGNSSNTSRKYELQRSDKLVTASAVERVSRLVNRDVVAQIQPAEWLSDSHSQANLAAAAPPCGPHPETSDAPMSRPLLRICGLPVAAGSFRTS